MKIQRVEIKKFKCLEDLTQEVNGQHILLIGDNEVGKSSFMQFIRIALGDQSNIPIGAEGEGIVIADKEGKEFTFQLKFKDGKPHVTIVSPDGLKDTRKGTLAGLVGAIDFDVDEFVELSKSSAGRKKQVEIFKSLLPLEVRDYIRKYEVHIASNYEERTEVNRKLKELEGAMKSSKFYGVRDFSMYKPVDVTQVNNELTELKKANQKREEIINRYNNRERDIKKIDDGILELEEKLAKLKQERQELSEMNNQAQEWLKANPEKDTTELEQKILQASEINLEAQKATEYQAQVKKHEELTNEAGELTALIDSERQMIADCIRNDMDSPVAGLTYDDETLLYNGVPVSPDNLSTSTIMELGAKLMMAKNPEAGILFLPRMESMGSKRRAELFEMMNKNGWQLIGEVVEPGTKKLKIEIVPHQ